MEMEDFKVGDIIISRKDAPLVDTNLIGVVTSIEGVEGSRFGKMMVLSSCVRKYKGQKMSFTGNHYTQFSFNDLDDPERAFSLGRKEDARRAVEEELDRQKEGVLKAYFGASMCSSGVKWEIKDDDLKSHVSHVIKKLKDTLEKKGESTMILNIVDRYLVHDNAITVFFKDGSTESVVCSKEDTFDLEIGIEKCILKKLCGKNSKNDIKKVIRNQENEEKRFVEEKKKEREEKIRLEEKRRKNAKKRMEMRARYEARYQLMLEEEKARLRASKQTTKGKKKKTTLNETN